MTWDLLSEKVNAVREAAVGALSERMDWNQICAQHEGEWVLLVDVDWVDDIDYEPRTAVVVGHSKERRDTLGRVNELPENIEFAHFFIPKPGYRE